MRGRDHGIVEATGGSGAFSGFYPWLLARYPVDAARNLLPLFFGRKRADREQPVREPPVRASLDVKAGILRQHAVGHERDGGAGRARQRDVPARI